MRKTLYDRATSVFSYAHLSPLCSFNSTCLASKQRCQLKKKKPSNPLKLIQPDIFIAKVWVFVCFINRAHSLAPATARGSLAGWKRCTVMITVEVAAGSGKTKAKVSWLIHNTHATAWQSLATCSKLFAILVRVWVCGGSLDMGCILASTWRAFVGLCLA